MWWLHILAVVMVIVGGVTLIRGKLKLTKKISLTGWWARTAGLFLLAPLPHPLIVGVSSYSQPSNEALTSEFLLVFGGLAGALTWIFVHRLKDIIVVQESGIGTDEGFTGKTAVACVVLVLGLLCGGFSFLSGSSAFALYRGVCFGGVLLLIALALVGL
jgi:hypothetical protein